MSKILFCITGSISAYKACEVISLLKKSNYEVKTVVSKSALNFIGPATLEGLSQNPVNSDSFQHGQMMSHIDLARWADLILVCPASAHTINGLAHGTLEGLIGEIYLANNFLKPFVIAPSMNTQMLLHPAVQNSLLTLEKYGAHILPTQHGTLACGETGLGRLLEPTKIIQEIEYLIQESKNYSSEMELS